MSISFMSAIKRRTIARDLTLSLTITIIFVTASIGLLYYVSSISSAEQRLNSQAMAHADKLSDILDERLLKEDEAAIIIAAWDYQRRNNLAVLRVFDANGEAIYNVAPDDDADLVTVEKSIYYLGEYYLGSFELSLTKKDIIEAQQTALYLTLVIMFSVILSTASVSWLLLKAFLTKPLATIAQGIEVIAGGSYDHVLTPADRWDIDIIIDKINVMASQISAREDGLKRMVTVVEQAEEEVRQVNRGLEARITERTRELEIANQELEAFTYSVSHDLRAPLRAIDGFSEALLEDYTDKLDEEGKTYLRYLQDGTRDMSELIDGLLKLSRSTRGELSRKPVDLSALVKTVVAELRQAEPEQQVVVQVAADMQVDADPRLLKVVLENLIGNAWKYSSQTADAAIEVGVEEQEGETVYFIKDNGAGFDMAFADKLFQPFQRLHRADEFSGTGIGLATVERIIHRHGGRIWAEAAVGEGASFYFTLGDERSNHG